MANQSCDIPQSDSNVRFGPAFLIYFHIAICCVSLIYVAEFYSPIKVVMFDASRVHTAALNIAPIALVSIIFAFSRFSFGYLLGFYFYTIIVGYLWLVVFSRFNYDHGLATISALGSLLAFLLPALFITAPIRQMYTLSARALTNLLHFILIFSASIVAIGSHFNFRFVDIASIYDFRNDLQFPTWLGYAIGIATGALLPFAFACFVARGDRWRSAVVLVLLLLFYPVTLSKLTLFAPAWLVFLMLLPYLFEARTSVVLSLFLPLSAGVILALLFKFGMLPYGLFGHYFAAINFRMIAIPSSALDYYNDFFSTHDITGFCQISLINLLGHCPYNDPLSVVMERTYQLGNFNASLFATEGVASVGVVLAPFSGLACGLVIGLGNRLSAGLPSRFVLLSAGLLPQVFLNVPLATTVFTNGAFLLFLLWYVTPRAMFEPSQSNRLESMTTPEAEETA